MTSTRQMRGRAAEVIVRDRLEAAGWQVVAANVRPRDVRGELDLIALDGPALVFIEVKARGSGSMFGPEVPAGAVDARKQQKIRSLAAAWLRERGYGVPRHRELRFDVVGLRFDARGEVTAYEHIRAAF